MINSDPLEVLLKVKKELGITVSDKLISDCYRLQSAHQFDKERDTSKKMEALIETAVLEKEGNTLL